MRPARKADKLTTHMCWLSGYPDSRNLLQP